MIFAPRGLLREPYEVRPGDVVVVANLRATEAAEKTLRYIGASAVEAVSLLVVDAVHFVAGVKVIPAASLIGMKRRALRGVGAATSSS